MVRNAFALLMCSRGIPMFLAGDEFCNTQFGNNNAYCQDNLTSWLDWRMLEDNRDMFRFFQFMIALRKRFRILRTNLSDGYYGFPDVSFHGVTPWHSQFEDHERYVGVLFAGQGEGEAPQILYAASNAYWKSLDVELPELPSHLCWEQLVDTWDAAQSAMDIPDGRFSIGPRSVKVFAARPR
jgi:glycogen operon protein